MSLETVILLFLMFGSSVKCSVIPPPEYKTRILDKVSDALKLNLLKEIDVDHQVKYYGSEI